MEISSRNEENVTILSVEGEIDLESSPVLREQLKKLSNARCARLLINFSNVSYIDSSGLATVIEYFQSSQSYQGKLGICALTPRIKNSFSIVRLDEIFSIYPDEPTGLAALAAS
jgi:anti-sigma B factor antagonist